MGVGAAGALLVIAGAVSTLGPAKPSHNVVATVVQTYETGAHFPRTVIVAHVPGAIDAHASFRETDNEDCRVGYDVDGIQTGATLVIKPYTCRPTARTHATP